MFYEIDNTNIKVFHLVITSIKD